MARLRVSLLAGVAGPLVLWGASIVVAAAWPGYDPIRRSISSLANAPLGGVQTLAFAVSGLLQVAFALGLASFLAERRARRVCRTLFVLLGVLTLLFALFPTDPPGAPRSPTGRLHLSIALAVAVAIPAACFAAATAFRRDARLRSIWLPTLAVGLGLVVMFPALVASVSGPLRGSLGLVERLYFLVPSLWQVAVAGYLLRGIEREPPA